jgi:divalent metal cation (Fe/Co/Zn/Cd) transporter
MNLQKSDLCFFGAVASGIIGIFVTGTRFPTATLALIVIMVICIFAMAILKRRE